jgi:hypothetical protein
MAHRLLLSKGEKRKCLQHKDEKENEMNALTGLANRLASMVIGTALALVGLIFIALGITFLPVIGILIAIPVMGMSFHFLNPKLSVQTLAEEAKVAREESAPYCTWPAVSV